MERSEIHLRLPAAMAEWVRAQARKRGHTAQMVVKLAIEAAMKRSERRRKT